MAGGFAVAAAVVIVAALLIPGRTVGRGAWVVAAANLPAGVPLTAGDLRTAALGLTGATATDAATEPAALVGRTLAVPVGAGQLILAGELAGPASPLRPVTLTPAASDLVDLAPGDLVDVLVTSGTPSRTSLVVRGARVLATDAASSGSLGASATPTVTVGVGDLSEVEALVAAGHAGALDVVLGAPGDGTGLGGPATGG